MLVASNGVSAGNGGWGCECPQRRDLLVAMGQTGAILVKAVASRAPASRLATLTGCRGPAEVWQAIKVDCLAERSPFGMFSYATDERCRLMKLNLQSRIATTVADLGSPSMIASSPTIEPGPRIVISTLDGVSL